MELKKEKISLLGVIIMIVVPVAGGGYGIEDLVGTAGPGVTMLVFIAIPFLWSLPFGLVAAEKGLTQREREVMGLAYQGLTNPEIAEALTISRYTVKRHMHNLIEKLQIQGRMELVHLVGQYKK
ncbi:MAG: helix-turn-helix transcriptional regulator [Firmicutes bacterium]|nr:helix-turn-helix transcriptional regulator [Bacillota bacterium]